jgi:hypothetical protein
MAALCFVSRGHLCRRVGPIVSGAGVHDLLDGTCHYYVGGGRYSMNGDMTSSRSQGGRVGGMCMICMSLTHHPSMMVMVNENDDDEVI